MRYRHCIVVIGVPLTTTTNNQRRTQPPHVRGFITTFDELLSLVELVGGAHQVGDPVLLQQLDVVVHGPVLEMHSIQIIVSEISSTEQKCINWIRERGFCNIKINGIKKSFIRIDDDFLRSFPS